MQQIITKFGGTSVASWQNWQHILTITSNHIKQGVQPVIVCSAYTGISNQLEQIIKAALVHQQHALLENITSCHTTLAKTLGVAANLLDDELQQLQQWLTGIAMLQAAPPKTCAQILSLGELMMSKLGHAYLQQQGIDTLWFDARQALLTTEMTNTSPNNYLAARCQAIANPELAARFANSGAKAVITQGFIAANSQGETVLLGRGGSDTSAALMAALLQAQSCEIWTDVAGIYTANPHKIAHARLLKQLNYDEAQEIASMGAKVLHPASIAPVKKFGIPMAVKFTQMPSHSGTHISQNNAVHTPLIKAILTKENITLITIETMQMWQQAGFLAEVFQVFKTHGFSVDLLSSSQCNITLSLDNDANVQGQALLTALIDELNQFCRAKVITACSAVSLVGHQLRKILPKLGPILEIFEAQQIYLMSLPANDLNLTFVVEAAQADNLCRKLHAMLIENNPQSFYYAKSFAEEFGVPAQRSTPWWQHKRSELLALANKQSPCYVYDTATQLQKAKQLLALRAIDQVFYAIKANPHPSVLKALQQEGIFFECVSQQEVEHIWQVFPNIDPKQVLFTPNFASKQEYAYAFSQGCHVTVDNIYPLKHWPDLFRKQSIFVRIDSEHGAGHHKYVCTAGNESKFGIPQQQLPELRALCAATETTVIGLHAHSGSGILTPDIWQQTAQLLVELTAVFHDVSYINLGGGLGVVEQPGQQSLDLAQLDEALLAVKKNYPRLTFWLEPGRYFVAESGVLLAKVTQTKLKDHVRFIGIETGMNSLLRPALYGAYHEMVNLTRLFDESTEIAHIVGPICESADILGHNRLLPASHEHDVILIANSGAYGHCMSSTYNLRPPAAEIILTSTTTPSDPLCLAAEDV